MWNILNQLFTSVSAKVMDIYLDAYPTQVTSTWVNNCRIGRGWQKMRCKANHKLSNLAHDHIANIKAVTNKQVLFVK